MDTDLLVATVRDRARARGQDVAPKAQQRDLDDAERRMQLSLPSFYRRLLLEVGNGGFGPGPLCGMPPDGAFDDDLRDRGIKSIVDVYLRDRASVEHRGPQGLIHLCNWGCGKWSHLDCATDEGAVLTSEWLIADEGEPEGLCYWRTSPSLAEWLREWAVAADPRADLSVDIIGKETRKNPFTGLPREYPITRPRGPVVDLSGESEPRLCWRPVSAPGYKSRFGRAGDE